MNAEPSGLGPLVLYFGAVVVLMAAILGVSALVGQRHHERTTGTPYESGIVPTGSARLRFPAGIYLIAMFFVIFDLESVFVFAWAVAARELGWAGYAAVSFFTLMLLAALVYLWRSGALELAATGHQRLRPAAGGGRAAP